MRKAIVHMQRPWALMQKEVKLMLLAQERMQRDIKARRLVMRLMQKDRVVRQKETNLTQKGSVHMRWGITPMQRAGIPRQEDAPPMLKENITFWTKPQKKKLMMVLMRTLLVMERLASAQMLTP